MSIDLDEIVCAANRSETVSEPLLSNVMEDMSI